MASGRAQASVVLLVDDDEALLSLLGEALGRDFHVETARDGDEAWQRLQRLPRPDLVVTDIRMPKVDGAELASRITSTVAMKDLPVILLTAQDDTALRQRMLELGASDYLVKPFPTSELRLRVRNTLRNARLLAELQDARDRAEAANAALIEVNTELDRFASTAAHDLQAPLATIASFARILADYDIDAEKRSQILGAIAENADRARTMVTQLLEEARTLGKTGEDEVVDLGHAISRVADLLSDAIEESGAHLVIQPAEAKIRAAPIAVDRVLLNLVSNAIKYVRPGQAPVVEVSWLPPNDEGMVELVVADRGTGIPLAHRERVFRHGERAAEDGDGGGHGIGLATCRRVVAWYGGQTWLSDRRDGAPGIEVHATFPKA